MTDEDLRALAREITKKGETRPETIAEVRSRLKGSDSADYGWFVWRAGQTPGSWCEGRFEVLEGRAA